jgi:hypothetical protein
MRLSQSHNQSYKFDRLTQDKSSHVFLFFSIRLSRSDNPSHEFSRLTWVIFYVFLIDFF